MKKKRKFNWPGLLVGALFVLLGMACGVLMAIHADLYYREGQSVFVTIAWFVAMFIGMYLVFFAQVAAHEAGHLVFGLLTGYRFSSFRIGSHMWVREDDEIYHKRMTISGTGGQCLMVPPPMVNGRMPYRLYNMGGVLMNLIVSVIAAGLCFLLKDVPFLSLMLAMLVLAGLCFAAINGIPMRMGSTNNDGYNMVSAGRSERALRALWLQLQTNAMLADGARLRDLPDEWFEMPDEADMKNDMVAAVAVFCCNRLIDQHRFDEAKAQIERLLAQNNGIVDVHRCLMICDLIFLEIIGENRDERIEELIDQPMRKFLKAMKRYPTVMRTRYLRALRKGRRSAEALYAEFERSLENHPYAGDVQIERELVALVVERLNAADAQPECAQQQKDACEAPLETE